MRDPENELYDRSCDLVEAAAAIRHAIRPEAAAAVPALLGCLNVALADLRLMSSRLLDVGAGAAGDGLQPRLADLGAALREAEVAAEAARMLVARSPEPGAEDNRNGQKR